MQTQGGVPASMLSCLSNKNTALTNNVRSKNRTITPVLAVLPIGFFGAIDDGLAGWRQTYEWVIMLLIIDRVCRGRWRWLKRILSPRKKNYTNPNVTPISRTPPDYSITLSCTQNEWLVFSAEGFAPTHRVRLRQTFVLVMEFRVRQRNYREAKTCVRDNYYK